MSESSAIVFIDIVQAAVAGVGVDAGFARQELDERPGEIAHGQLQLTAARVDGILELRGHYGVHDQPGAARDLLECGVDVRGRLNEAHEACREGVARELREKRRQHVPGEVAGGIGERVDPARVCRQRCRRWRRRSCPGPRSRCGTPARLLPIGGFAFPSRHELVRRVS